MSDGRKTDPRLRILEELRKKDATKLRKLKERERDGLRKLVAKFREKLATAAAAATAGGSPKKPKAKSRMIPDRCFSPLTSGLHFHDEPVERRSWGKKITEAIQEPYYSAFIVGKAGSEAELEALQDAIASKGVVVRSRIGPVFTVLIPASAVPGVEEIPAVRAIEIDRPMYRSQGGGDPNDALGFTGIRSFHVPLVRGSGTIVGVVDFWLDLEHPDFIDNQGKSRVLWYWDQAPLTGTGPAGGQPPGPGLDGLEYFRDDITNAIGNRNLGNLVPQDGHGTHVAGCAAGGGRHADATGAAHPGAAPAADIIFVRCKDLNGAGELASSTALVDAVKYIFDKAAAAGKPCVVVICHNDNLGPHDGTSPTDLALRNLLTDLGGSRIAGRAIVVSAGNYNGAATHVDSQAAGTVQGVGTALALTLTVSAGASAAEEIEIWYEGPDRFDVSVTSPPGARGGSSAPVPAGGPLTVASIGARVTIDSAIGVFPSLRNRIRILLEPEGAASIPKGDWTISLSRAAASAGGGTFDAWVGSDYASKAVWATPSQDRATLAEPATGDSVIVVGDHYVQANGTPKIRPDSGRGPTRDTRNKPDLAAVGTKTAPWPTNLIAAGLHMASGTSVSAPLVAGACALLFDPTFLGPNADCDTIKNHLVSNASPPYAGFRAPSDAWGAGCLHL